MLKTNDRDRARSSQAIDNRRPETAEDGTGHAGNPIRKATGFMSNSDCILDVLNKRCFGKHGFCSRELGGKHQDCIGRTAKRTAIYSDQMCEAILAGTQAQLRADKRMRHGEVGIHCTMDDGDDEVARTRTKTIGRGPRL